MLVTIVGFPLCSKQRCSCTARIQSSAIAEEIQAIIVQILPEKLTVFMNEGVADLDETDNEKVEIIK
jgi:hypothetical protein